MTAATSGGRARLGSLAGAAAIALVGLDGCSATPPHTESQRRADAQTAEQVTAALNADPRIFARHIDVRVESGVAHLSGFVWSATEQLMARNDAAHVPGVRSVADEMELARGGARGASGR